MKSPPFLMILCLLFLVSCFGSVGGNSEGESTGTIFVSSSNNTGKADGSEEFPFITIQVALDRAKAGDLVVVLPGVYDGGVIVRKDVRLIGAGSDQTTIDAIASTFALFVDGGVTSDTVIEGFTFTGAQADSGAVFIRSPVIVQNCVITGNGPVVSEDEEGGEDDDDEDEDVISFVAAVRFGQVKGAIVRNCAIVDNDLHGVATANPEGESTISGCLIACNSGDGIVTGGRSNSLESDFFVENCTVAFNGGNGLLLSPFSIARVYNSIFFGNGENAIEETDQAGDPELRYNDIVGGYLDADEGGVLVDSDEINALSPPAINIGNVVVDPLFLDVDAPGLDLGLQATSPLINNGDPSPSYVDRDGSQNDIGASGGPNGTSDLTCSGALIEGVGAYLWNRIPAHSMDVLHRPSWGGDGEGGWRIDIDGDGVLDFIEIGASGRELVGRTELGYQSVWTNEETIRDIKPVDFDQDGRLDMHLIDDLGGRLLQSTKRGYVDVTSRRFFDRNSVIGTWWDIDHDGDEDWIPDGVRDGQALVGIASGGQSRSILIVPDGDASVASVEIWRGGRVFEYPGRGPFPMTIGLGESRRADIRVTWESGMMRDYQAVEAGSCLLVVDP